jgi:hypothetical protein
MTAASAQRSRAFLSLMGTIFGVAGYTDLI